MIRRTNEKRTRRRKHIIAAGLLASGAAFTSAMPSTPAHAAGRTWVYVSMPTWLGNCPRGGSVKYLNVSTWGSVTDCRADGGDDLVYIGAAMNENTTVVARGLCYNGQNTQWGPAVSVNIRATRQNQTFWIGPAGVRNN